MDLEPKYGGINVKRKQTDKPTLPYYALPHNTDSETLTPLAQDLARDLEVMGVFDQREYEPAHVFALLKEKIHE